MYKKAIFESVISSPEKQLSFGKKYDKLPKLNY